MNIFVEIFYELKKIFGLELLTYKAWAFTVVFASFIGAFMEFIDLHIWSPSGAYITFLVLLIADFSAAVKYAWCNRQLETRKLPRVLFKMISYTLLFAIAHNLAKYDPFYFWLPQAVYFPSVAILLLSFVKNLSLLNYVPEAVAKIIKDKIDIYKDFKTKENESKESNEG